jgi:hypothetical protein
MTSEPSSPARPARTPGTTSPGQAGLLRCALALAGRGWHVFPCVPGGKQPALRGDWQDLATTDPAVICGWWARRPFNIGIACGPSGLVVLDLDVSKGPGHPQASGVTSLARLCDQAGQPYPLPTFTVATPSGGYHLYFTAAGQAVTNSASRLGPRIDVRANGGYVVGPGSTIGGRAYAVRNDALLATLPRWITDALRKQPPPPGPRPAAFPRPGRLRGSAYAMAALRDETRRMATATDGTRHDTLNKAAFNLGQLVGAGLLPAPAVTASLTDAARRSGLPERDIPRIIRSGMIAGTRHPRLPRQHPPAPIPGTQRARQPRNGPAKPTPPRPSL